MPEGDAGERARAVKIVFKGKITSNVDFEATYNNIAAALQSERTAAASEARRSVLLAAFETALPKADEAWSPEALDVMNIIRERISNLGSAAAALPVTRERMGMAERALFLFWLSVGVFFLGGFGVSALISLMYTDQPGTASAVGIAFACVPLAFAALLAAAFSLLIGH